jgi:uncharacterized protein (TIGR02284 family)
MTNQKTIAVLRKLVATCKDGEKGYQRAAKAMSPGALKDQFSAQAEQRTHFATELLAEVHRLDTAAVQKGSAAGVIHRGWMKVENVFTRTDPCKVIAECERGEVAALKRYERALRQDMPAELRDIVSRQYAALKEACGRAHGLRVLETLRGLMATCVDGERRYGAAMARIPDGESKEALGSYKEQRARFADDLASAMQKLGGKAEKKGTATGALRRGWAKVKAAVTGGRPRTVLRGCKVGERSALRRYERALKADLPADLRALVERQCEQVREACVRLHALENQQAQPAPGGISATSATVRRIRLGEPGSTSGAPGPDRGESPPSS